jgi:rare lipoprotein A
MSGYSERGVASWYGQPFNGRHSANGEVYDMYKLTAAHRTLPFDTLVRVTNLSNGMHTDVRITDRGPFVEDRVIDLSYGAARAIGMIGPGTAMVRIDILSGSPIDSGSFTVQIGAFSDRANAERLKSRLAAEYKPIFIQDFDTPGGHFFRVRVGSAPSVSAAQNLAAKLRAENGFSTFVVRLDELPAANSHSAGGHQ